MSSEGEGHLVPPYTPNRLLTYYPEGATSDKNTCLHPGWRVCDISCKYCRATNWSGFLNEAVRKKIDTDFKNQNAEGVPPPQPVKNGNEWYDSTAPLVGDLV